MIQNIAQSAGPILEERFPGLRFERWTDSDGAETINGWGAIPVQASGTMPDMRPFYFRFRGDCGWLSVWDVDAEPNSDASAQLPAGEATASANVVNFTGYEYCGWLNTTQAVELFSTLVDQLAPVTEENPTHLQVMTATVQAMVAVMTGDTDTSQST